MILFGVCHQETFALTRWSALFVLFGLVVSARAVRALRAKRYAPAGNLLSEFWP